MNELTEPTETVELTEIDYTFYLEQLITQQDVLINRLEILLLLTITILTLMLYKIFKRRQSE